MKKVIDLRPHLNIHLFELDIGLFNSSDLVQVSWLTGGILLVVTKI